MTTPMTTMTDDRVPAGYRYPSFLKRVGDTRRLKKKACPTCKTKRLMFNPHNRLQIVCQECGLRFKIKGIKLKEHE
jgi:DNA-directed RNA polymerase subunit RPC12/RpoP